VLRLKLQLFCSKTLGICESNGICSLTVLKKVTEQYNVQNYDWCEFIIDCLRLVKKPKANSFYVGPIVFLTVSLIFFFILNKLEISYVYKYIFCLFICCIYSFCIWTEPSSISCLLFVCGHHLRVGRAVC
jgi:hypothetical protein